MKKLDKQLTELEDGFNELDAIKLPGEKGYNMCKIQILDAQRTIAKLVFDNDIAKIDIAGLTEKLNNVNKKNTALKAQCAELQDRWEKARNPPDIHDDCNDDSIFGIDAEKLTKELWLSTVKLLKERARALGVSEGELTKIRKKDVIPIIVFLEGGPNPDVYGVCGMDIKHLQDTAKKHGFRNIDNCTKHELVGYLRTIL